MEAAFSSDDITSDSGAVLLRQADRVLGLTNQAAGEMTDPRRKASYLHLSRSMLLQRVYALVLDLRA